MGTTDQLYDQRKARLEKILRTLKKSKGRFLPDAKLKDLGIEFHQLDIDSGATSPSVTHYFSPRSDFPSILDIQRDPSTEDKFLFRMKLAREKNVSCEWMVPSWLGHTYEFYCSTFDEDRLGASLVLVTLPPFTLPR